MVRVGEGDLERAAAAVPGAGDLERLPAAALLFGAGDWDLLLCPTEGVGSVRLDLVGVFGGEGAASLDAEEVLCLAEVMV